MCIYTDGPSHSQRITSLTLVRYDSVYNVCVCMCMCVYNVYIQMLGHSHSQHIASALCTIEAGSGTGSVHGTITLVQQTVCKYNNLTPVA